MCVRPLFDGNVDGQVTTSPTSWVVALAMVLIMPEAAVGDIYVAGQDAGGLGGWQAGIAP